MGAFRLVLISLVLLGTTLRGATENELKAAYVLKFAGFATWPREAGGSTFVIGVVGGGEIVAEMERAVAGAKVRNRPVVVRKVGTASDAVSCQILYIASGASASFVAAVRSQPVLTVGDSERFTEDGGIIALKKVGNRLRFVINKNAASQARIELSAQLLRLSASE